MSRCQEAARLGWTAAPTPRPLCAGVSPRPLRGLSSLTLRETCLRRGTWAEEERYLRRCAHPRPAGSPAGSSSGRSRRCWRTPGCSAGPHTRSRLHTDQPGVTGAPARARDGTEVSLTWSLLWQASSSSLPPGLMGTPGSRKRQGVGRGHAARQGWEWWSPGLLPGGGSHSGAQIALRGTRRYRVEGPRQPEQVALRGVT